MTNDTCLISGCVEQALARGACGRHYGMAWRAGNLDSLATPVDRTSWHRLSEVDHESRTAVCSQCGPVKIRLRSGRRGAECMVKRSADRRRYRRTKFPYQARWKYGLAQEDLDALLAQADGRCLICDTEFGDDYNIDHCHETGTVRGLLCRRCNFGLGWFDDDPGRLLAAHFYLQSGGKAIA